MFPRFLLRTVPELYVVGLDVGLKVFNRSSREFADAIPDTSITGILTSIRIVIKTSTLLKDLADSYPVCPKTRRRLG